MKKQICFILAALILTMTALTAYADTGDKADTAIRIEPGEQVSGSLVSSNDHDYYVFTLPAEGYIRLSFSHEYVDNRNVYWKTDILDGKLQKYCTFSWVGDSFVELYSGAIGLDAGTYYIHVYPHYHSSVPYTLTVHYEPSDAWEKEGNDTPVNATRISVNKEYSGILMSDSDTDCYRFSIPSDGYVSVGFSNEYVDSNNIYWKMEIFDAYKNVYLSRNIEGSSLTQKKTCDVGLPAGEYFLKIWPHYWSMGEYSFSVGYEPSASFETEDNNTPPKADPISVNAWYGGAIASDKDKDYYSFTLNGQSKVAVSFRHEYVDSSNIYWVVRVLDINQKEQLKVDFRGNGSTELTSDPITLGPGTYFVYVDDHYNADYTYHLMVSVR